MSQYHHLVTTGAPTFTAAPVSLSLSGLDDFSPTLVDPEMEMLDPADWFRGPDEHGFQQSASVSPPQEHFSPDFGPRFPSHGVVATQGGPQYPTLGLTSSMDPIRMPMHLDHGVPVPLEPRLDELSLGTISPLQSNFPPYTTPYPDSTASSAPSEEPLSTFAEQVVDEDKRKRNQAASARFRQKKKQREQQMLEQSREMVDKTKKLESEVDNLKRENTFLKKLLVEKVDNMSDDEKTLLAKTTGLVKKD
ncbi:hypothetical protein BCR34DRAFT_185282 [Clohesyomyces aquaticus]|uniref:BZIP domain-containing protein n=1 Tax=Clohesyomyces aquaticus TaxID=1231657 RepID=A0A1Y1YEN2_9PLEO|nr:hypothetical protein BCR34DRAFT_185282 [Clohesyomyces aquaticus]